MFRCRNQQAIFKLDWSLTDKQGDIFFPDDDDYRPEGNATMLSAQIKSQMTHWKQQGFIPCVMGSDVVVIPYDNIKQVTFSLK